MPTKDAARGFTLIELMVALGMALAVTSAALGVMLVVMETQRDGQRRNSMTRDAQIVMDTLRNDLRYLGVGVPRGYRSRENGNIIGTVNDSGNAAAQLRPPVRIAASDYIAFLGDLPFPNADLNGLAQVSMLRGNPSDLDDTATGLSVSSELSGCAPQSPGATNYRCNTSAASTIQVGGTNCTSGSERSCPWGLNKWHPSAANTLIVGAFDGRWFARRWVPGNTLVDNERLMIHLDNVAGQRRLPANGFIGENVGGGFVAHLDRVFYSYENVAGDACDDPPNCVLRRKQCWGWDFESTSPASVGFPGPLAAPLRSNGGAIADCADGSQGTPWEPVVEGLQAFSLTYFDGRGQDIGAVTTRAALSRVRSVRVSLTLQRKISKGRTLDYTLERLFYLENAGGIISIPRTDESNGGCWGATATNAPANECNPQ